MLRLFLVVRRISIHIAKYLGFKDEIQLLRLLKVAWKIFLNIFPVTLCSLSKTRVTTNRGVFFELIPEGSAQFINIFLFHSIISHQEGTVKYILYAPNLYFLGFFQSKQRWSIIKSSFGPSRNAAVNCCE